MKRTSGPNTARRGFTFTEIMFAVMILGIGFIMVAAMFPVAIQQTQATQEESAAAGVAQIAMQFMQRSAAGSEYPHFNDVLAGTGNQPAERVQPLTITLNGETGQPPRAWDKLCGSMIFRQDPRYAWVPLYRRGENNNYAQVVFFILQARATDGFADRDLQPNGNARNNAASFPLLYPRKVLIDKIQRQDVGFADAPDTIRFNASSLGAYADIRGEHPLAPGAFVVLGQRGGTTAGALYDTPTRIYRLGNQINDTTFELAPGYGMSSDGENLLNVEAWVMGRQRKSANDPYEGPVMDIGCFSSFILFR